MTLTLALEIAGLLGVVVMLVVVLFALASVVAVVLAWWDGVVTRFFGR